MPELRRRGGSRVRVTVEVVWVDRAGVATRLDAPAAFRVFEFEHQPCGAHELASRVMTYCKELEQSTAPVPEPVRW